MSSNRRLLARGLLIQAIRPGSLSPQPRQPVQLAPTGYQPTVHYQRMAVDERRVVACQLNRDGRHARVAREDAALDGECVEQLAEDGNLLLEGYELGRYARLAGAEVGRKRSRDGAG